MDAILENAINNIPSTEEEIHRALHDICDRVHSSCDDECPVYELRGDIPWNDDHSNCKCFKNGKLMLDFLKKE